MKILLFTLVALFYIESAFACVGGPPAPDPGEGDGTDGGTTAPVRTLRPTDITPTAQPTDAPETDDSCAEALGLKPAGSTGYKDGGPVEDPKKLDFDASKSNKACWKNHKPPQDEIDYVKTDDASAAAECTGDTEGKIPSGPAMIAYSPDGENGDALFHSCSILCSNGPAKVTVTGAKSSDVKMKICTADSFTNSVPKGCKDVKFGKPVKVGGDGRNTIYDVVIKSSGFQQDTFAAIKKIKVDFDKCEDEPPASDGVCAAACEFGGDTCGWARDPSNAAATEFKAYEQPTIVGNLDSGVNARLDGNPGAAYPIVSDSTFMAAPQNPGDLDISSMDVDVAEEVHMTFDVYEACDGNAAKVCFDTLSNCPFTTNPSVAAADREWKKAKVPVPAGTKKIFLVGDNSQGQRFCATGFSHVNFAKPDAAEGDPPLCGA